MQSSVCRLVSEAVSSSSYAMDSAANTAWIVKVSGSVVGSHDRCDGLGEQNLCRFAFPLDVVL